MNRSWANIIKVLYAVVLALVMFAGAGVANVAYARNRCVNIDSSYTNFGDGLVGGGGTCSSDATRVPDKWAICGFGVVRIGLQTHRHRGASIVDRQQERGGAEHKGW